MEAGHSGLFAPAYRLVQELLAAKRDLSLPRQLRKLDNYDFLLLDDLGYLPQGAEESKVLFTLIVERYERRSLGITAYSSCSAAHAMKVVRISPMTASAVSGQRQPIRSMATTTRISPETSLALRARQPARLLVPVPPETATSR